MSDDLLSTMLRLTGQDPEERPPARNRRQSGTLVSLGSSSISVMDWARRNQQERLDAMNNYGIRAKEAGYKGAYAGVSPPSYDFLNNPAYPVRGQQALFSAHYTPPVVHHLYGTTDRHPGSVSRALGVAALESHARWGAYPVASHSLSEHSAPLVEKVRDSGALPEDTYTEATNTENKWSGESTFGWRREQVDRFPAGEHRDLSGLHSLQGQQFFRDVTGQTPKPKSRATQETLF